MSGQRQERGASLVLSPSSDDAAFVIVALRKHAKELRRNGVVVPAIADQLEDALTLSVSQGQQGSSSAGVSRTEQVVPMTPRLVTYETAAQLLAVSLATLKRQVKAGVFHPINLGGGPRIRVSEIDDRVAAAAAEPKGA